MPKPDEQRHANANASIATQNDPNGVKAASQYLGCMGQQERAHEKHYVIQSRGKKSQIEVDAPNH
jgi:hypothetical protein